MLSKTLVLVIVAVITAGAAASVTTYYVVKAPTSQPAPSSQNNHTSNNSASGNELVISNHWYYFGVNPQNPFKETTYIFIQLSEPLIYNDFIHIYYHHYDLARWWVNKTQAYHSNISVPLNMLTNLNGTLNIEIMRGEKQLYNGTLKFITQPILSASAGIYYDPLNYTYARAKSIFLELDSKQPIYISSINVTMGNLSGRKNNLMLYIGTNYVDVDVSNKIISAGNFSYFGTIVYPLFPSGKNGTYTFSKTYVFKYSCKNATISNVSISSDDFNKNIIFKFSILNYTNCPISMEIFTNQGLGIDMEYKYYKYEGLIYATAPYMFNFNGSYYAVLLDYFGNTIDRFNFTVKSGPLLVTYHHENMMFYDWENQTEISSITLNLKNMGNTTVFLDKCNLTISYSSNNTIAFTDTKYLISESIDPYDIVNLTIYPYAYLAPNQTYDISYQFWGSNQDVIYSVSYQIRT